MKCEQAFGALNCVYNVMKMKIDVKFVKKDIFQMKLKDVKK